jgi:hypothetical protein
MKMRKRVFTVFTVVFVLSCKAAFGAGVIETRDIARVREKGVLDSKDFRVIDDFVSKSVGALVKARDFTSISRFRAILLANDKSNKESAAEQYSERFLSAVHKSISKAFDQTEEITLPERRARVIINLLILIDRLADLRLADLAISKVNNENRAIRYWAVRSLTQSSIVEQLNSGEGNTKLAGQIIEVLRRAVETGEPEILFLVVSFAGELNIPEGEEILLEIADMRIKRYADWTVTEPFVDVVVLKSLFNKTSSADITGAAVARRFGQLYSYVMERYIAELKDESFSTSATDELTQQLASVLVEAEDKWLIKLLGARQTVIKRAVEKSDCKVLEEEYRKLFGDENEAGELALKLNFDYGRNADNSIRQSPFPLPPRPEN